MIPPPEALAVVPGLGGGEVPLACERLVGGTVNDSWGVETRAGRFVLRLDGPAWRRPGVDRRRELLLHGCAAAAGLAPPIVQAAPARGLLVTEFVAGEDWTPADFEDPRRLSALGERLAVLHALPAPQLPAFSPLAILDDYLARCEPATRAQGAALRPALAQAVQRVGEAGRARCIVHGDLVHSNLRSGQALWLLDWEYAQVADPAWDLGCVVAYYPSVAGRLPGLLAAAGLAGAGEAVLAAAYVYGLLSWAWHRARGEPAEPPALAPRPSDRQTSPP
jgi:aminoglycoside phosphotransferase (APT) family kinase protein